MTDSEKKNLKRVRVIMYVKSLSIILLMYIKRSKVHVETGTGSFTTQGEVFLHVQLVKRPSLKNRAAII